MEAENKNLKHRGCFERNVVDIENFRKLFQMMKLCLFIKESGFNII